MNADAGLASIQARFNADLGYHPNLETGPEDPHPQDPMARLILAIGRNTEVLQQHDRRLIELARAIYPVPIPAMPYTVTSGALGFGAGYGGSQTMGPRTGEFWDVTRLTVDGLQPGGGQAIAAGNNVTNPGLGVTIATVTPVAGSYFVNWSVDLEGTVTAADANNMKLTVTGTQLTIAEYPGVVGEYPQGQIGPIEVPAGSAVSVKTIAAASGASAIYSANISLVPVAVDQISLFKRYGSPGQERLHTFTAPGSTPGPDWQPSRACIMRDGDALQLNASGLSLSDNSQIILSGEAIRVSAEWIGDYLK